MAGTLPGVVAGAVIRVELLPGDRATAIVAAAVLLPLGVWLLAGARPREPRRGPPGRTARRLIPAIALLVGVVGGVYGIGGGSLLAPILLAAGMSAYEVAPATLAATFMTSVAGIATFEALQLAQGGVVGPDWALGLFLGAGGFAGSYAGARMQRHLPETALRRLLGVIACAVAVRYIVVAATSDAPVRTAAAAAVAARLWEPARAARRDPGGLARGHLVLLVVLGTRRRRHRPVQQRVVGVAHPGLEAGARSPRTDAWSRAIRLCCSWGRTPGRRAARAPARARPSRAAATGPCPGCRPCSPARGWGGRRSGGCTSTVGADRPLRLVGGVVRPLREHLVAHGGGAVHQRQDRHALQELRPRDAGEVADGGVEVDVRDAARRSTSPP